MEKQAENLNEIQEIIEGIIADGPVLSDEDQLRRLKKNEAAINIKKINYYLKDMEKSKRVYGALRKILPEITINPSSQTPVTFKTKTFNDSCTFLMAPVKEVHATQFLFNVKAKNKKEVQELMEDITDLWHATDCDRELYELFGFSFDEYKMWLSYS